MFNNSFSNWIQCQSYETRFGIAPIKFDIWHTFEELGAQERPQA